jgi:hypothetical protein
MKNEYLLQDVRSSQNRLNSLIMLQNNQKGEIKMYDKGKLLFASFIMGALLVASSQYPSASEVPEVIELDHLGDIYEQVIFDHAMHLDIASCATCHHHTMVACKGCHAINPGSAEKMNSAQKGNIFHLEPAGLKRAYHLQCMGCHKEMDVANDCNDCHPKKG